jgi:DNA polymerase-3 subunit delta'
MINKLVLHSHTKDQVAQFIKSPSHAMLLIGSHGMGKTELAISIAEAVLNIESGKASQHPYFTVITPEKDSISIDAIRKLQHFLQLKTLGNDPFRRAVVVEHADALTTEAQNAYLKLLEEPPADTIMILTTDNQRALLPTISSRVQAITMHAPVEDDLKKHFLSLKKDNAAVAQAYFLSGGLPGLMHALLKEDTSHPLVAGVAQAKSILQKQLFERLAMVESLSKSREDARYVVQALQHIAQTCLVQATNKEDHAKLKQWHRILSVATDADQALAQSANTKLVLSNLMLHIN